jgi:periplasmic mercuric ion binding protein
MKTFKFIIAAVFVVFTATSIYAQASKTEVVKVWGNCDMCKAKIEKAAKITGVSKADWNTKTKVLTVVYNPATVKSDDVQKSIAAVGYDTEKFKADDKAYAKLPGCCQYERKK